MGNVVFWICFAILLILVLITGANRAKQNRAAALEKIKEDYLSDDTVFSADRFDSEPELFRHIKENAVDDFYPDDITVSDLALKDLYSRMNRTVTGAGEEYLYTRFHQMYRDHEEAAKEYEAVCELSKKEDEVFPLLFALSDCKKLKDTDGFSLIKALINAKTSGIAADIIPLVLLVAAIAITPIYPLPGLIAVIVMIIACIATYFAGKNVMDENIRGLSLAIRYIECAEKLAKLGRAEFDHYRPLFSLTKAGFLIPYTDGTTSNPLSILYDYLRMITHIDLIAYKLKISAIKNHYDELLLLYTDIGRLDTHIAVSSYFRCRSNCAVKLSDKSIIKETALYHPLVKEPVKNDISAVRGIVITGSNASGKSTFLKAVGISALFARSFGFAFADSYETGYFDLYTSMTLSDNLLGGESYYVVEARSLKRICDAADKGNVLCIVDEVLRGTNTVERIAASTRILMSLAKSSVLCFAATHDLELPTLLEGVMDSYYFTEEIQDGNVVFPYRINSGVTDRTNAVRLLDVLGFDKNIVSGANDLVAGYKQTGKWVTR